MFANNLLSTRGSLNSPGTLFHQEEKFLIFLVLADCFHFLGLSCPDIGIYGSSGLLVNAS